MIRYSVIFLITAFASNLITGQEVNTTKGKIKGSILSVNGKQLNVFYGIPFAKPPIGNLRYRHPKEADPWGSDVLDATKETPSCIQSVKLYEGLAEDARPPDDYSEDCLHLNIWQPRNASSRLAVMVWIYGGGFSIGTARTPVYNGKYLAAENDVIVVTFNYRIGPLGFAYLGPGTIPGNMGLMDQVMALKWVKENIDNFGGDRDRITIFGESAGSISVGHHLLSSLSQKYFNNAIMQSGVPVNSLLKYFRFISKDTAQTSTMKLAQWLPCPAFSEADAYDCLMKATPQEITAAADKFSLAIPALFPIKDGYFIEDEPLNTIQRRGQKKTNIMAGFTKDEASLFLAMFVNQINKTLLTTGEQFGVEHIDLLLTQLLNQTDRRIKHALRTFYVSEQSPPVDALSIMTAISSDTMFKCPTLEFSSLYSQTNQVYVYSLNYRLSTIPHPAWMGVPHSFDLDLTFGLPVNHSLGYNQEDKILSQKMRTYWSNFAKSGNPNFPVTVEDEWPVFDPVDQSYMALNGGSDIGTREGLRRHQCAFINEIMPMISKEDNDKHSTYGPYICMSGSRGLCLEVAVVTVAVLITMVIRGL